MLKKNFLREKLASGRAVVGTLSVVPSVVLIDVIASSGIDFIIIDSEHGPIGYETAQSMVIACESRYVSPVMRVSGVDEGNILKALDIGVHCVQIPNIASSENVKRAIALAKYPPIGDRGFSPFTRAGGYSLEHAQELTKIANENVLLAIHIEGKEAIDNIDRILEFKEIDIIFIGIFDISKSLGIPGDVNNPKVLEIVKNVAEKITKSSKYPGTIANSCEQLKTYIGIGMKYITFSVDCEVIRNSYKNIKTNFKKMTDSKVMQIR